MCINLVLISKYAALNWRDNTSTNMGSVRRWLRTRFPHIKWVVHNFPVFWEVLAFLKTGKLYTTHFICGNLALSQRLTDPILTDVVSRQYRAAYLLITTTLIHMSWSESQPSWVILRLFTFELYVIEIFRQNSVLMLYIRPWPSWRHVSSGRHIGWLRLKL